MRIVPCAWPLLLCLSGCDRTDGTGSVAPAPTLGVWTASASGATSAAPAEPYADAALPDPADFAPEAERDITADNARRRLDELEREVEEAGRPLEDPGR